MGERTSRYVGTAGYSREPTELHFFTLVLNGMPFLRHHIDIFSRLECPWKWHIVEGVADLKHDTAWSAELGGRVTDLLHRDGLSNDGSTEYIDELRRLYPENVRVYRKPGGQFWDGKLEMCNAVLQGVDRECLLWQIDVDEFWRPEQLMAVLGMFQRRPEKTAAWFYCRYFVGPRLTTTSRGTYGNNPRFEWLRVWRYAPGMFWQAHEPPTLVFRTRLGPCDVGRLNPFTHAETEAAGLTFDHLAYVLPKQLAFKDVYYGYRGALTAWERLQDAKTFPLLLRDHFRWVRDRTTVEPLEDGDRSDALIGSIIGSEAGR